MVTKTLSSSWWARCVQQAQARASHHEMLTPAVQSFYSMMLQNSGQVNAWHALDDLMLYCKRRLTLWAEQQRLLWQKCWFEQHTVQCLLTIQVTMAPFVNFFRRALTARNGVWPARLICCCVHASLSISTDDACRDIKQSVQPKLQLNSEAACTNLFECDAATKQVKGESMLHESAHNMTLVMHQDMQNLWNRHWCHMVISHWSWGTLCCKSAQHFSQ